MNKLIPAPDLRPSLPQQDLDFSEILQTLHEYGDNVQFDLYEVNINGVPKDQVTDSFEEMARLAESKQFQARRGVIPGLSLERLQTILQEKAALLKGQTPSSRCYAFSIEVRPQGMDRSTAFNQGQLQKTDIQGVWKEN